ncbi:hypothetical protein AB0H83_05270 [Dactylosporangium sp. NPDC050688]|uniref:hypothetical protein n=1 Tax=Dactylosporangium sp. NPDC050688 TaxID=3157217 RepID=UPI0033ED9BE4
MPVWTMPGRVPLPVASAEDVAVLVAALSQPGADTRGLADHFSLLAGTRPEWLRPHREHVIAALLDRFEVGFDDLCVLLAGAPDRSVELLAGDVRAGDVPRRHAAHAHPRVRRGPAHPVVVRGLRPGRLHRHRLELTGGRAGTPNSATAASRRRALPAALGPKHPGRHRAPHQGRPSAH